jgi:hypothetical protein
MKAQELAFSDDAEALKELGKLVLKAQRASVKLPIIAKAVDECSIKDDKGNVLFAAKKGQTVICDIVRFLLPTSLSIIILQIVPNIIVF